MNEETKEERRTYSVVLPVKLMQSLTIEAVGRDKSRSDLLEEILTEYLSNIKKDR